MATLADIIAASRAVRGSKIGGDATPLGNVSTPDDIPEFLRPPSQQWSNKDLTPAARRARLGVDTPPAEAVAQSSAPYVAPDGGRAEQDRLLAEAKAPFDKGPWADQWNPDQVEAAGNRAQMESLAQDPLHAALNQGFENFGRGMHAAMNPVSMVKGAVSGIKDAVGGIAGGLAQIPEGVQAEWDILHNLPDTVKGVYNDAPTYANDIGGAIMGKENEWARNPEQGGEAVAELLGASAAPDAVLGGLKYAPKAAGAVMTKTGQGLSAIGEKAKGLGKWSGPTAAMGHPIAAGVELAAPPALRGLGGALQRGGAKMSAMDIPASLRALGQTDVLSPINRALTPLGSTADPAAESVAATVRAARNYVANGASRGQAAQKAGWPLAGDFELDAAGRPVNKYGPGDFGTHPGQNVEAHRPYKPGDGSLGGLRSALKDAPKEGPKSFADSVRAAAEDIRPNMIPEQGAQSFADAVRAKAAEDHGSAGAVGFIDDAANLNARRESGSQGGPLNAVDALTALKGGPEFIEGAGTRAGQPYYAGDVLAQRGSQEYLARQSAQNAPIMKALQAADDAKEMERYKAILAKHQAANDAQYSINNQKYWDATPGDETDLSAHVSPEQSLAKLSRKRAVARSHRTNEPRSSRY